MMRKPWFWPAMIVGLLLLAVGANVGLMIVASSDPSFAVEEDYYDKAVPTEKEAELLWGEKGPQFRKRIVETLQKRFGPNFEETKYKKIFKKRVNLREN